MQKEVFISLLICKFASIPNFKKHGSGDGQNSFNRADSPIHCGCTTLWLENQDRVSEKLTEGIRHMFTHDGTHKAPMQGQLRSAIDELAIFDAAIRGLTTAQPPSVTQAAAEEAVTQSVAAETGEARGDRGSAPPQTSPLLTADGVKSQCQILKVAKNLGKFNEATFRTRGQTAPHPVPAQCN